MTTTWNPSDKNASNTLSNGNRTVTLGATGQGFGVRATKSLSGKVYYEGVLTTLAAANHQSFGIANLTADLATYVGDTGSNSCGYVENGFVYLNAGSNGGFFTCAQGDVICIAVDTSATLIWWRKNAGAWSGTSGDPATGVGGFNISTVTGTLYPAWSGNTSGDAFTSNFNSNEFAQAIPSGFSALDTAGSLLSTQRGITGGIDRGLTNIRG